MSPRRISFRGRLAVLIGSTFVVAGVALLAVQYALVAGFFTQQVNSVSVGTAQPPPGMSPMPGPGGSANSGSSAGAGSLSSIRDEVLRSTLVGSLLLVVLLAVGGAAVAWWLSGRLVARIGEITRLAGDISATDLTTRLALPGPADEITQLGDTFDAMLDRLQEGFDRQERFVANASHELRTPLAATRTALEAPLLQGRFAPEVVPDVRRALAANQHSEELIAALLQLARAGQGLKDVGPVALDDVVEAVVAEHADAVAGKRLRVETSLEPVEVFGNQTMLIRAVTNLVENAVKYTPEAGTVRITLQTGPGSVDLVVDNAGRTFSAVDAAELVEPFRRGDRSEPASGHGLGLAIVDAVARAHGGGLELTPRSGGGLVSRLRMSRGNGS